MMLVTEAELAVHLGMTTFTPEETARATQIITHASGVVQRYCNLVGLVQVPNDEITLRGVYGPELVLPRPPVESVASVEIDGVAVSDWELVKGRLVRTGPTDVGYPLEVPYRVHGHWGGTSVEVAVTYTHGLAVVPDEAASVCLDLSARRWSNPTGARSFSIDGYSASWGSGANGLTDDEKAALSTWHRSAHTADLS